MGLFVVVALLVEVGDLGPGALLGLGLALLPQVGELGCEPIGARLLDALRIIQIELRTLGGQ